jgi:hypothetical protein
MIARRRVLLYLTEEQYLALKQLAGEKGSMAKVVREWIDAASPSGPSAHPVADHVPGGKKESGKAISRGSRVKSTQPR